MKRTFTVLCLLAALNFTLLTPATFAQSENFVSDDSVFVLLAQSKKKLTESEAAKQAQKRYGGKVVGVVCREQEDRVYCSVRLDIDGRIKTVTIRG